MGHINYHRSHALYEPKKSMRSVPKSVRDMQKSRRKRVKRARALNRQRKKLVEGKYGYHTYHQCTSKRYYKDRRTAEDAILSNQAIFGGKFYAYHCPLCGGWHLSTRYLGGLNEAFGDSGTFPHGGDKDECHR